MNIGLIANTYYPNLNGVSVSLVKLVEELKKQGVNPYVVVPRIKNYEYPENILPVRSLSYPKRIHADLKIAYLYKSQAIDFFKEHNIELLHSHETMQGGNTAVSIAKRLGIPHIHTYHTFVETYNYFKIPAYKLWVRQKTRYVCNNSELVIAPSPKIRHYLLDIGLRSKIKYLINIPNNQHLKRVAKDKKLLAAYGIKPQDFVFITFGRVAKEKGLDRAIKMLEPLLKQYPDMKYLIAGKGQDEVRLKALVEKRGLEGKVVFAGTYTQDTLSALASLGDCFLFTSTSDNQPGTILEAMTVGLPVVSIDDDSVDYLVVDGENGFKREISQLPKFCEKLYKDRELLERMSKNAEESARALSGDAIVGRYIDVYKNVIEEFKNKPIKVTPAKKIKSKLKSKTKTMIKKLVVTKS